MALDERSGIVFGCARRLGAECCALRSQAGAAKRIAAKQRKENAVFLGMESGWRTNASFDFIEPSARPQFHRNGV